ncbi:hypothetical protein EYC80_010302 [Monilinia laxa]|uniref:Uncharacterized protein n=1 Tax=Monilinia laxa TaxID=61186 RepID=A0A5N6JNB4_MONLA|nr:hypothetical protein EYC80_010302 [Monilinia laxa]
MVLSKKQESVIIDILGFAPETWIPEITLQAGSIPEENRVEFGQRLLNRISSCQVKVQHTASILRRGPNLDPEENPKAFSLMHASYLSHLFVAHPTLCERLCGNLVTQTHNHGWEYKIDRWREIESNKLKIKDQIAEEINRDPRSETDDRFSLVEIMDAMEYVGQHPAVCRKMFDLWPAYRVFQEYNLEAWKVIREEVEEETKQKQRAAASAREGLKIKHAAATTRITRSSNRTVVKNSSRCSSNEKKKRRRSIKDKERESDNADTDDNEEKEPAVKKARHRHLDSFLNHASPSQPEDADATPNPQADNTLDFIPEKKPTAPLMPDPSSRSTNKIHALASSPPPKPKLPVQAPAKPTGTIHENTSKKDLPASPPTSHLALRAAKALPTRTRVLRHNRQKSPKSLHHMQNELLLEPDLDFEAE